MKRNRTGEKRKRGNQVTGAAMILAVLCAAVLAAGSMTICFGQTIDKYVDDSKARESGGFDLNLYYDGISHKTHISCTGSLGSGRTAHEKYVYLRNHRTTWTMASGNTSVATVTTPVKTDSDNFSNLMVPVTLKIPAGFKTARAECIDKISPAGQSFGVTGFSAGMTGQVGLSIGGRVTNWGVATNFPDDAFLYYNPDLEFRITLEPIAYTLSFDPAGGTFAGRKTVTERTVLFHSTEGSAPGAATRTGYRFDGWYTAPSGGQMVFDGSGRFVQGSYWYASGAWVGTEDLTVYAHWTRSTDFSYDHTVSGIDFEEYAADESGRAGLDLLLGNGQELLLPGLDDGAEFQIEEGSTEGFIPSYSVSEGGSSFSRLSARAKAGRSLATRREQLTGDAAVDFLNEKESGGGTDLTLRKELAGDLITESDRQNLYLFRWTLQGLDPREQYTIDLSGATDGTGSRQQDQTVTPASGGTASGTVRLHGGEKAVFRNLPEACRYTIGEEMTDGGQDPLSAMWYEVRDGEQSTNTDYRFFAEEELRNIYAAGGVAGTGEETLTEGVPVEYLFTNSRSEAHDLAITKEVTIDGETAGREGDGTGSEDRFRVIAEISGLAPDHVYGHSGSGQVIRVNGAESADLISDSGGLLEAEFALSHGEQIIIRDLPGSADILLTEGKCAYEPSIEVNSQKGRILRETGLFGQGMEARIEGLDSDTEAVIRNDLPLRHTLTIRKEYDGVYDRGSERAEFSIYLSALEAGREYALERMDEDGVSLGATKASADTSGECVFACSLQDLQSARIAGIPTGASYRIVEAADPKAEPTYILTSPETEDILSTSGHAEKGGELSTPTEKMSGDRSYSFYNRIVTGPVKTVSDDDETEVLRNEAASLEDTWLYHIHQDVDVPVSGFRCYDTLPPYVRTRITGQESSGGSQQVLCAYWRVPGRDVVYGGSCSEVDQDSGEYLVKDGEDVLFRVRYDENEGSQTGLRVDAVDERMLSEGGSFDLYFPAYVDPDAGHEDLEAADCCVGSGYRFVNEASTRLGTYLCEAEPVVTRIPAADEKHALTLHKKVTGSLGDRSKKFSFTVEFYGLAPETTYSWFRAGRNDEEENDLPDASLISDDEGNARVSVALRDDESATFEGLPEGVSYRIGEAASDHVASYRQEARGPDGSGVDEAGESFVRRTASNGNSPALPLQTERETIGQEEEEISVVFANNRDLAVVTGLPGGMGFLSIAAGILLILAAAGLLGKKIAGK